MHYVAHADLAFASVEHIMRDVNYGWLIRYIHSNGASMFFLQFIFIFLDLYFMVLISLQEKLFGLLV